MQLKPVGLRASLSCTDLAKAKVLGRSCPARRCSMNGALTGKEQVLPRH